MKNLIILLVLNIMLACQSQKKIYMPVYNIEISHPDKKIRIEPVVDKIITLENTNASLP